MVSYSDDLFVSRPELDRILDEIETTPILTLVSPPGTGKTWLMQAVKVKAEGDKRLVLFLDLPQVQNVGKLDTRKTKDWLRDAGYGGMRKKGGKISRFRRTADISHSIATLVETVDGQGLNILVIVDGYDEIPVGARREVDKKILYHFIRRACARVLMAYRSGCRLEDGRIRNREERLGLDPLGPGLEQLRKLYKNKLKKFPVVTWISDCRIWMGMIGTYQWDHPLINRFLFERALQQDKSLKKLKPSDYCKIVFDVVRRPDKPVPNEPLDPAEFDHLIRIARGLERNWMLSDYERHFGVEGGHNTLDPLLNKGVVEYVDETQRYRVVPGLYELLRLI